MFPHLFAMKWRDWMPSSSFFERWGFYFTLQYCISFVIHWLDGPLLAKYCLFFFNMLSKLVITFLPRSKGLLISWLQSPSAVILILGSHYAGLSLSSLLQSFPASGSFPRSQLFTSSGHNTGVSASTSVLPMNTQDWSPLRWTGWISLQFKGLSGVFSNTTVQKHQFFTAQVSLRSNSHIHTWLMEKS